MNKNLRPRGGYSPILDRSKTGDPRARATGGEVLASPLKRDSQDRITVAVAGPLKVLPDGRLDVNVGAGLVVATGSPAAIMVQGSDSVLVDARGIHSRPSTSQVRDATGSLADTLRNRVELIERKDVAGGYAGLDARGKILPAHGAAASSVATLDTNVQVPGIQLGGGSFAGVGANVLVDTTPPTWGAVPVGAVPAHATTHNTGGTDPLTALSATILTSGDVGIGRLAAITSQLGVANGIATLDASTFVEQDPASASAVSGPNAIVRANGAGHIDIAFLDDITVQFGVANGVATLDPSALVEQDPASASATSGVNAIVKANGSGKIDSGFISALGTPASGNATNLTHTGKVLARTRLTSGTGATFTPNALTTAMFVEVWGAGGGGGGAAQTAANAAAGGGGGAGGYASKLYTSVGSSYTYTIATGGAGGTAGANDGSAGSGTTTFDNAGSIITVNQGSGGKGCAAGTVANVVAGGAGGSVSTSGDHNSGGSAGGPGIVASGTVACSGIGAARGDVGGGGSPRTTEAAGVAGTGNGSGGSGGCCLGTTAKAGGAGKDGLIIVTEWA